MTEGSYEYECMRAELLGVDRPDRDEFHRLQKEQLAEAIDDEQVDAERLKEAEAGDDRLKNTAGKLDELNSILALTQKKINSFKSRCGSVSSFVRTRFGSVSGRGGSGGDVPEDSAGSCEHDTAKILDEKKVDGEQRDVPRKSDLAKALDNHVDKLDGLLEKSENAQYAMFEQRKQMQRYLKK